jgi:hypothetical protein
MRPLHFRYIAPYYRGVTISVSYMINWFDESGIVFHQSMITLSPGSSINLQLIYDLDDFKKGTECK